MSRAHTMFIQSQALPWMADAATFGRARADYRVLSQDAASGAATLLIRYPAGWHAPPGSLGAMEELFVLDGELQIGDECYGRYAYACLPAHLPRGASRTGGGAVVLTMFDAYPAPRATSGDFDERKHVRRLDTTSRGLEGWIRNPHTRYLQGTGVQTLREDPDTGEITILYSALPFRFMEKRWSHAHVQEMYVLAGEYAINDVGVMRPGAYAWWEPHRYHGPYGSQTGFLMLIRSVGGPLVNLIEPDLIAVDYFAPYRPELPDSLRAFAREMPPVTNY